jgi:transmembrane sensor
MKIPDDHIDQLLVKYREGKCTPQEINYIHEVYNLVAKSAGYTEPIPNVEETGLEIWDKLSTAVPLHQKGNSATRENVRRIPTWISVAAAMLLITFSGVILYHHNETNKKDVKVSKIQDLSPGKNSATLTLSNGKKVILSKFTQNLAEQNGVNIIKGKSGELIYEISGVSKTSGSTFNTLSTGNGEQYQVKLPDGTKVWLNAGSSLTYPTIFSPTNERVVKLTGEAYFEVATNKDFNGHKNPFVVETNKEAVKVLGTHFNINNYNDEPDVRTTLLEGSIELTVKGGNNETVLLKPNQRSTINNDHIRINTTDDAEDDIAWKEGLFHFDHTEIKTVMRQLARWYNVEVIYKGEIPDARFTGEMYKNLTASKVLEGLNYTGLHFAISNRQIIVSN